LYLLVLAVIASGLSGLAWRYWWRTRRVLIRLKLLGQPANVLRNAAFTQCTNSGFPDYWGIPSAGIFRDSTNLLRLYDESPVNGARSIRLNNSESNRTLSLQSYNIACDLKIPDTKQPYTFSLYLKSETGQIPVQIAVVDDQKEVIAGTAWTRHFLTVNLRADYYAEFFTRLLVSVAFTNVGSVCVAAPQLEVGTQPTSFTCALIDDHPLPELPWPDKDEYWKTSNISALNVIPEFSSYAAELEARLLVESSASESAKLIVERTSLSGVTEKMLEISYSALPFRQWVNLDISSLSPGLNKLSLKAVSERDQAVETREFDLVKLATRNQQVRINQVHRCLTIDDKPFPVFGVAFDTEITDDEEWHYDDVVASGFNTVALMVNVRDNRESGDPAISAAKRISAAYRRGLQTIVFISYDKKMPFQSIADSLSEIMGKLKDHPGILAWQIVDEPFHWWTSDKSRTQSQIGDLYTLAKGIDPERPVFINEAFWNGGNGKYKQPFPSDIGIVDNYPIGRYTNGVKSVADTASIMNRDCLVVNKPSGFWLQLYGGWWDGRREPTTDEVSAMTYINLIWGTRILLYWLYKPVNPSLWSAMKPISDEVARLFAILTDDRARWICAGTNAIKVHYAVWRLNKLVFLVACNAGPEAVTATFEMDRLTGLRVTAARSWYTTDRIAVNQGRFNITFPAYQRYVIEMDCSAEE